MPMPPEGKATGALVALSQMSSLCIRLKQPYGPEAGLPRRARNPSSCFADMLGRLAGAPLVLRCICRACTAALDSRQHARMQSAPRLITDLLWLSRKNARLSTQLPHTLDCGARFLDFGICGYHSARRFSETVARRFSPTTLLRIVRAQLPKNGICGK
jgi:hypothetical protein